MTVRDPVAELHPSFSSPDAAATPWAEARPRLEGAEVFWLSTVRPNGRPHVTPLIAVWLDPALYFCTGSTERKAKPGAQPGVRADDRVQRRGARPGGRGRRRPCDRRVDPPTGCRRLAAKYGEPFVFTVRDGAFVGDGGEAVVFEVRPTQAFGFGKGDPFSQTRWRFQED